MNTKKILKRGMLIGIASSAVMVTLALYPSNSNRTILVHPGSARYSSSRLIEEPNSDLTFSGTIENSQDSIPSAKRKIKIALLLDTSGSMDGLIDQAKAQLWKLVNELTLAKYENDSPLLEIALYDYGNDSNSPGNGYVRQIAAFTDDLDLISEKLFSLKTNGGSEYCGEAIAKATSELNWDADKRDFQVLFIAGNEPFNQGSVNYINSCNNAKEKEIVVNTIYCGDYQDGLRLGWEKGAGIANGNYMSLEQNKETVFIETPYDNEIAQLNDQLNNTYINFGKEGSEKKTNQLQQDKNAANFGKANMAQRAVSKSGKFYSNASWDLVDATKNKSFVLNEVKENDLPAELKGKSIEEKQVFIAQKTKEREEIIKQIQLLNEKRNSFLAENAINKNDNSLDAIMVKAIREQAMRKNFVFN